VLLVVSPDEDVDEGVSARDGVVAAEVASESEEPLTAAVEREGETGPLLARLKLRSAAIVGVTATSWEGTVEVGVERAGVDTPPDAVVSEGVESIGVTGSCLISLLIGVEGVAAALAALACLMTLWSTVNWIAWAAGRVRK
jgi:hypothetical protein